MQALTACTIRRIRLIELYGFPHNHYGYVAQLFNVSISSLVNVKFGGFSLFCNHGNAYQLTNKTATYVSTHTFYNHDPGS